jgi:hypothetical protein
MRKAVMVMMLGALVLSSLAHADVFMKKNRHTDPMKMMGMTTPAKDETVTTWVAEGKMSTDSPESIVIVRIDKDVMYNVMKKEKKYMEIPLSKMVDTMADPKMAEAMKGLAGQMKITVTETSETKTINSWKCRKYIQVMEVPMMGPMSSEIWASPDIKIDYEMYFKAAAAAYSRMPGMSGALADMVKEMKKIKGMPVLTTTTMKMMGSEMKSSEELVEVKEDKAPANVFEVPAGYKKVNMGNQ